VTKNFPTEERFGITNQLRRAYISIVSNIAEVFGRNSAKDKSQFYSIAKGSVLEVQAQCLVAKDLKYISDIEFENIENRIIKTVKLVSGLIRSSINR
jgi:four helix bundle protein